MGGINLALGKDTKSSSYVMPYSSSRAVDGVYSTSTPMNRWLCNTVPCWLSVDFGAQYFINRWVVRHMGTVGWRTPDYSVSDFKLQYSNDNANWTDIDAVTNNISSLTDRSFTDVQCRYVRLYVTKGLQTNNKIASIMELEVYQAPASSLLTGLSMSNVTLVPAFAKGTFSYTSTVDYSVASTTVTPIAVDPKAVIKVNGTVVASGTPSSPVNLNVGANTITVQVTAADGSSVNTYTITVTRLGSSDLTGIGLSEGTLQPTFGKDTIAYTSSVDSNTASITVTPTALDTTATITVNTQVVKSGSASQAISLSTGNNTITVVVQGAGVASKTYTITVIRPSSFYLTSLVVKGGRTPVVINPTFDKNTIGYTASAVGTTITSVTITPSAEDINAVIKVNGTVVANNTLSLPIALNTGVNNIYVTVTSNIGGLIRTYTIAVSK